MNWDIVILASAIVILRDPEIKKGILSIKDKHVQSHIFLDKTIKMAVIVALEILDEIRDDQGRTYHNKDFMTNIKTRFCLSL